MSAELHEKVTTHIVAALAKKEGRQCVRIEVIHSQKGFRDDELRSWTRVDEPTLFDDFTKIEPLVSEILKICTDHADSYGSGAHRYVVRTHQFLGGRESVHFKISPSYDSAGDDEETALVTQGGSKGASDHAMGVVTQNNLALMRQNTQMFQASFGTLAALSKGNMEELMELRKENRDLRRQLDEAENNKLDKEFEIAQRMEKSAMKSAGFKQLMQFATIAAAKLTGGANGAGGKEATTPLGMLVYKFGESLRQDQIMTLMNILDMGQKALFMEIMGMVAPKEEPSAHQHQQQPSNGQA